jgi:hypothetical protein
VIHRDHGELPELLPLVTARPSRLAPVNCARYGLQRLLNPRYSTYIYSHTYSHTHILTHTHTYTHAHTHTYTHTYSHAYSHTHILTHMLTHTLTHTHTHTYTHTHTHTYTQTHRRVFEGFMFGSELDLLEVHLVRSRLQA